MVCRVEVKTLLWQMKPGERGRVTTFLFPEEASINRLVVLGFLPGEEFELERRCPDFLVRYGYTRLAINRKAARMIVVSKLAGPFVIR